MIAPRVLWLWSLIIVSLPSAPAASIDPSVRSADQLRLAKEWNATAEQYMDQGAYEEARRLYLRSLPVMEKRLGPDHAATVTTLGNLCDASIRLSAYLDAKPLCTRALAARERVLGPNHPDVARSLSDLGILYANEGNLARAESLLRRALEIENSLNDSPDMPALLNNFGFLYAKKKKYALAEDSFERAISATEKARGPEAADLVTMFSNVANVYLTDHKFGLAEERFRRALAITEQSPQSQIESVRPLVGLARAEAGMGKASEARTFLRRAQSVVDGNHEAYLELRGTIDAASLALLGK